MEKFDAIIVGGGLAGLAAAYTLAGEGLEVLVLERGDYAGAKNVTGGRIYLDPLRELFPELWEKAPLERGIAKEELCMMSPDDSLSLSFRDLKRDPSENGYQSYSVLRAKFDRWFSKQVEGRGAALVTKSRVDKLLKKDGKVIGVVVDGEELGADVVIAADGVLSLIAEEAGLRKPGSAHDFAVGIKEIIEMDKGLLEDRFALENGEGAARMFMGDVTRGKFGGGFLYTNKESISLGLVLGIHSMFEGAACESAPALLEAFKARPEVARLLQGGTTVEYSAHVVPEGGQRAVGSLYGDGVLVAGDAAALCLNLGLTVRGMDYAMLSGYFAAQAVLYAREKGDFGATTLKKYEELLNNSLVLKDFETFKKTPDILDNPRLFAHYPQLAGKVLRDLYEIPAAPKRRFFKTIRRHLGWKEIIGLARDARKLVKL